MARQPRRESESGIHHVMNRGVDRQCIFFADADRQEFGRRLRSIHRDHGVATLAYCLMGNHYHLLLRAPPDTLSVAMKHLSEVFTRRTNDRVGRDGPLFRGRFLSIPVETDAYLVWAGRYIHRNPLDLPGVTSPRDYRWSSYCTYLGLRPPPDFLDLEPLTSLCGGRQALAEITEADTGTARARRWKAETVTSVAAGTAAVEALRTGIEDRSRLRIFRDLTLLLAEQCTDASVAAEAVSNLDLPSPDALRAARHRAAQRLRDDPITARLLQEALAYLGPQRQSERWGSDPD